MPYCKNIACETWYFGNLRAEATSSQLKSGLEIIDLIA